MGLFDGPDEQARRDKLRRLEDKRLAFAEELARQGFAPERMLFAQTENGSFVSLCRDGGGWAVIVGPALGTDEDFRIARMDVLAFRRQDVRIASEGMGGIFGMGKKAQVGVEYVITLPDGEEVRMPFVGGRSSWMEKELKKNPLLSTKRRRGDANVCWEMAPVDKTTVDRVVAVAEKYFA